EHIEVGCQGVVQHAAQTAGRRNNTAVVRMKAFDHVEIGFHGFDDFADVDLGGRAAQANTAGATAHGKQIAQLAQALDDLDKVVLGKTISIRNTLDGDRFVWVDGHID